MKILMVKLSSLGDVVHTMPAVQDMRAAMPDAQIDWVVERGFAPLVRRCEGVHRVIESDIRRWRRAMWDGGTRIEWQAFKTALQAETYDAVIDAQGLSKSALVAWLARRVSGGRRIALANRTDGSSYEAPTRWVADLAVQIEPRVHAVQRARLLCARALGYDVPDSMRFGLVAPVDRTSDARKTIAFVHGTSRADKLWPEAHWIALGQRLVAAGHRIALPHGSDDELRRSERLAAALGPQASVWPRLGLDALTDAMGSTVGVVGVDSGLSHIAVALDLPHVQIYNFDTAWRTGPLPAGPGRPQRQCSVYAQPTPDVDAVWQAWQRVAGPAA